MMNQQQDVLTVGLGQLTPVWLNRDATMDKVCDCLAQAGEKYCDLVAFGESLVPGYPFWLELTGGARFNATDQKQLFAHYARHAVDIEGGDLDAVCQQARTHEVSVYLGIIERPQDRTAMSLYCSLVYINKKGEVASVHRKLMPTYEERLVWSPGDGHGLVTHQLGAFRVGGLNCWENWMPLPRAALYGQGETLHVATWPGSVRNTDDITPFLAKEGRSYVISVSGLMRPQDIPADVPYRDVMLEAAADLEFLGNGGSCLSAPDGSWVIEPQMGNEGLFVAEIDIQKVREERQNFDPAGHYSRPDVTQLQVNRDRQNTIKIIS